jgi:HSP20 family protein
MDEPAAIRIAAIHPRKEFNMIDTLFYRPQGLFDQLASLHDALSRSLASNGMPDGIRSVAAGSFPPVNVGRAQESVEVYAFAPGLEAASIDVTVERGMLKISGERKAPARDNAGAIQAYAKERPHGRFTRALMLPEDADVGKVEATYRDGVLRVSVGLQKAAQPQRVAVH